MQNVIGLEDNLESLGNEILLNQISSNEVIQKISDLRRKQVVSLSEIDKFREVLKRYEDSYVFSSISVICGWVYLEEHSYEEAIRCFEDGLATVEAVNDGSELIRIYSGLMCSYFSLGMYEESMNWGMKGLKLINEGFDDNEAILKMLGNMAVIYFDLGKYEDAKKTLESVRKLNEPDSAANKISLDLLEARLCLVFDEIDQAHLVVNRAFSLATERDYYLLLAETLSIRGMVHYRFGDYTQSRIDFKKSIDLANKYDYLEQLAISYYEWGSFEGEINNNKLAEDFLLKAYNYSVKLHSPLIFTKICKELVKLYKKVEDYKQALEYYEVSASYERAMELKHSEIWSKRLLREKIISEARVFKSLYDELQMISEIGRSFTQKLHYDTIVQQVREELSKLMNTAVLMITQRNIDKQCFEYVASICSKPELVRGTVSFEDEYSLGFYCMKNKKDLIIYNLNEEHELYHLRKKDLGENNQTVRSLICCPLLIQDEVIGYISLQSYEINSYTENDLTKLNLLASYIAIALENAKLYDQTKYLACYDGLTGVYNRTEVLKRANDLFMSNYYDKVMSVIMFDIDCFKEINDTYGHQTGDEVLEKMGALLSKRKAENVIFGRYGGEEFIVILNNHSKIEAYEFAEQLRQDIETLTFDNQFNKVTASFGVYEYNFDNDSLDDGISCADKALYESKMNGRNCVIIYKEA